MSHALLKCIETVILGDRQIEVIFKMIKISCEVPTAYLDTLGKQMHYEFCLAHIAEENEQYLKFYQKQVALGRLCILDNGVFELNHAIETSRIMQIYEKLLPAGNVILVAPDAHGDGQKTIYNIKNFIQEVGPQENRRRIMGVVQGRDLEEWLWCYDQLAHNPDIEVIGTPYILNFPVLNLSLSKPSAVISKTKTQMFSRIKLYEILMERNKLCDKPHHLLGTSDPYELYFQSAIPQIQTVDTSTPIVQALSFKHLSAHGFFNQEEKEQRPPNYFSFTLNEEMFKICDHNIFVTKIWARGRDI
jgi:hypothetical protein